MLLSSIVSTYNHTKCLSLNNWKGMTQPTITNLHLNEYSSEFHYYPFVVNLDRCDGSCNNHDKLSNKLYVSNKTKDFNLFVFNMITGINESRTLIKHISCKCEYKFDGKQYNLNQMWNNDKYLCKCKNLEKHCMCKKRLLL